MVASKDLARFAPDQGRKFRSSLFTAVENFLKNDWNWQRRKRRDVRRTLALDFEAAEIRFLSEPALDPEYRYNRAWALCVLSSVIARLRQAYCQSSSRTSRPPAETRFDALKVFLPGPELEESAYSGVAAALQLSPGNVKKCVCELRKAFGELLWDHLAELVVSEEDVEGEIQFFYQALALPPSQYELHRHYRQ